MIAFRIKYILCQSSLAGIRQTFMGVPSFKRLSLNTMIGRIGMLVRIAIAHMTRIIRTNCWSVSSLTLNGRHTTRYLSMLIVSMVNMEALDTMNSRKGTALPEKKINICFSYSQTSLIIFHYKSLSIEKKLILICTIQPV